MDMVANGSCPSSSRERAHTCLPSTYPRRSCHSPRHTSPQLCREGRTPVDYYMQDNQNIKVEVVMVFLKDMLSALEIDPAALTRPG